MLKQVLDPENQLFVLARQGSLNIPKFKSEALQNTWEFFYPLFVFFYAGATPLLSSFCAVPILVMNFAREGFSQAIFKNPTKFDSPLVFSMFLVFSFLPIFLFVWGWLVVFERRMFWTTGLERKGLFKKYSRGALIGFVMITTPIALLAMAGFLQIESNPTYWEGWSAIPGILILLVGWMVQGAAEETLTRGFLLPIFGIRFNPILGVLISSGLFALLHLFNANLNWIAMTNLFLFGVFASIYAMQEGGLWGVFAIHSLWNWTQGNLFGLEVSGSEFGATTLLNLKAVGPDLFTGGAFGPEGGIAVTLVLIAGCVFVYYLAAKKPRLAIKSA
jgi:membrane protease YdiL (CAAX protease family)